MTKPGSSPVRVGVVGAGAMGAAHVATLSQWVPGAVVTAVYDLDGERAASVAAQVGAAVAGSAEALIGSADVDAVLVAAPDPLHEELALACLEAGRPTLLEKPLATSVEGGLRVVEAEVAVRRRLLQLGFMRRFDPSYAALRAAVTGGELGRVKAAHCLHRNAHAHPSHTSDGVLVNSMIHELDCVPWLLDDPLAAVTVFAPPPTGDLHDLQVAVLETASGAVVTVEVHVAASYGYDIHTEVVGSLGTASLTPPYGVAVRRAGLDGRLVAEDWSPRFADAYRHELAAWVASVRTGTPTGPSAWDGHLAGLAATAAVESRHTGRRVEIEHPTRPGLYDG